MCCTPHFIPPWILCPNAYLTFPLGCLRSLPNFMCPKPNPRCSPLTPVPSPSQSAATVSIAQAKKLLVSRLMLFFLMCTSHSSAITAQPVGDHFLPVFMAHTLVQATVTSCLDCYGGILPGYSASIFLTVADGEWG